MKVNVQYVPTLVIVLGLTLTANIVILGGFTLFWAAIAAMFLTALIPGYLLVEWLLNHNRESDTPWWERALYAIGIGYTLMVLIPLLRTYFPGAIESWHFLLSFNLLITLLIWLLVLGPWSLVPGPWSLVPGPWLLLGFCTLLLVGGLMRFVNLGYSEFQGDEARALLRAAEVIQGFPDALLRHKKGPVEILIPTVIYTLTGRLNEVTARLPFAFANFSGLFVVFLLGRRMFGRVAGWIAAMLLALDGYLIGFAHIVQYQSIVFLMMVLVLLALQRMLVEQRADPRYLTLAALFLTTGLLAHYEAIWVILPAFCLLYTLWRRGVTLSELARSSIIPLSISGLILLGFYIPFYLDPRFARTWQDLAGNRVGNTFPYNNLSDLFLRTTIYSSSYYFLLLVGVVVMALVLIYRRNFPRWLGILTDMALVIGMIITFWNPSWLIFLDTDHTWFFFALSLGAVWFLPKLLTNQVAEERTMWIWFGATLVLFVFFVRKPNSHVYGFFIPWAFLVGTILATGWDTLRSQLGDLPAKWIGVPLALFLILLFGNYEYWYFVHTDTEILRTWRENRPRGYWTPYELPNMSAIFGFPLKNGWKTVGALYAEGVLDGPFDLNGKRRVAHWYTRGTGYCPRQPLYYIITESVEPDNNETLDEERAEIQGQGYQPYGVILVNQQPRLEIYKRGEAISEVQIFQVEEIETRFDEALSGPDFLKHGPVVNPPIQISTEYRFGESIWLKGYSLSQTEVHPGDSVQLTLYWQATEIINRPYKVFNQIINMETLHKAGQLDGDPACGRYPTDEWRPGDLMDDRYYIPIHADAPTGTYTLLMGMYDPDTEDRLDIFTKDGQPLGDALGLIEIKVQPKP